jgi:phosphopantetheinyl transferase
VHFELTTRREELAQQESEEESGDDLQSLSVQIQFKEDRIRYLAQRLGKQQTLQPASNANVSSVQNDSFLYDQEFGKICKGRYTDILCL